MSTDTSARDQPLTPGASIGDPDPGRAASLEAAGTPRREGDGSAGHADGSTRLPAEGAPGYPALPHTLELLLDVRINVSVEVGRVQMPVRQVMELGPGAVIELERSASEPVEIHANGRCIGRGEIVVIGEQFGVRVTELGPAPA